MPERNQKFINREISWLAFNDRVLQEAADQAVALQQRLKFLGIFSSNMDEFFRIRVATLKRLSELEESSRSVLGGKPKKILQQIQEVVLEQRHKSDHIYEEILAGLAAQNIFIINEKQLSQKQGEFVRAYFQSVVRPTLVPIMIDDAPVFPTLKDKSIYLAVGISRQQQKQKRIKHAVIELPTDVVPRFLVLPPEEDKHYVMFLDDVVRFCLNEIFALFDCDTFEAYTIKLTRDAELELDDDISESFLQKVYRSLKQRKKGRLVRFIYDEEMPAEILRTLTRKLKLHKNDNMIPGARYHNFKDFMSFPKVGMQLSTDPQPEPLPHPDIQPNQSLFSLIRHKDVLLHYPYQPFHYLIDLLREAAIDPHVTSIKMTLYRLASQSNVVNALINAVRNGKMVTAVVELQARFDEEANIYWANQLRDEGAKVIFGVPHMKVHSKLCVITRKEKGQSVRYGYIGTGNFNEGTARLYSDQGLLTSNSMITEELNQVFGFLDNNFKTGTYRHILLSPFFMRNAMMSLINKEISNARMGLPAYMVLKMNSLVDPDMIEKLYEASQAGVKIRLIIRGICSLKAGVEGLSDNIEAISIVDKYLEHSRVFVFGNGGDEKIYFGSADWMTRNLDHRVEVVCPVYDKSIQAELRAFLCIQLMDNTKARQLDAEQRNAYVYQPDKPKVRSQDEFYLLLKSALQEGHSVFSRFSFEMFGITEGRPQEIKKKKKKAKAKKKKAPKLQAD